MEDRKNTEISNMVEPRDIFDSALPKSDRLVYDDEIRKLQEELMDFRKRVEFCSFGMYMHGLRHRAVRNMRNIFGKFSRFKGKKNYILTYARYKPERTIYQFVKFLPEKTAYFVKETDETVSALFIRENGKWGLRRYSKKNDHTAFAAA